VGASLIFSDLYGIVGLIYANCVNMGIRITTSLYYAFNMEDDNRVALERFLKDIVSIDIKLQYPDYGNAWRLWYSSIIAKY
jgi:hypothetical protein